VHPLEELRYLARGWGPGDDVPSQELAGALMELVRENPASLVQACRRTIESFPGEGVPWWLCAWALAGADPAEAISAAAAQLAADRSWAYAADALPHQSRVALVGPSRALSALLRRRQDVAVLKKAGGADIVVLAARAASKTELMLGEREAALLRSASSRGHQIWVVVPRGALLPGLLWDQAVARSEGSGCVRALATTVDVAVGPDGRAPVEEILSGPTCPAVAELLGWPETGGR